MMETVQDHDLLNCIVVTVFEHVLNAEKASTGPSVVLAEHCSDISCLQMPSAARYVRFAQDLNPWNRSQVCLLCRFNVCTQ
jgi:hypothetical protein